MRIIHFYRASLWLYPKDFREQFCEEMFSVFEQRAGELFANGRSAPIALVVAELTGIVRGAYIMWMAKILPKNRNTSRSDTDSPTNAPLTIAEIAKQRDAAIQSMVAAIAAHDFINARRYSDDEIRLKTFIHDLQNKASAGHITIA
jgi:hypothetical protein